MESTRRIIIDITSVGEPCSLGMKVDHVKRTVLADNKEVYSDRMSERQYFSLDESDPIRNLEMSLLGLQRKEKDNINAFQKLLHFKDASVGLWCIDRDPKEVSIEWIRKNAFQLEMKVREQNKEQIPQQKEQ